jgi:hydrogenase maturation protease
LAAWGFAGVPRSPDAVVEPLNAASLALASYESGRPSAADACRIGDPRVLARVLEPRRD